MISYLKVALNKFLASMKKPVFKYYLHINMVIYIVQILLCFLIFMLNDSFL